MRTLGVVALTGLALVEIAATPAIADQCPQKESPIATDRPDVTNSSVTLPEKTFQNENGINLTHRNGGDQFDGTNSRLRWGIAPCFEVLVDIPTYFAALNAGLNSGFTDITPAIKWQISPVAGRIDLSATLGAGVPTGTRKLTGPGMQPYIQFPWSWDLGSGWGVNGMFTSFLVARVTRTEGIVFSA